MPWPPRQSKFIELERQVDSLQLKLIRVREQLTNAQQYAGRLQVLLRERSDPNDELHAKLEQLRAANEKLAEMVRLPSGPPSLDAA
jgi:hypothetical protein